MPRSTRFAAVPLCAALLGACAGPVVHSSSINPGWTPQLLDYAASKGGILVEVQGNPFQAPKEELDAVIVETMAKHHFGQKVPFFSKAPPDFGSPYRVVVALNPGRGISTHKLCAGTVETRPRGPQDPDRVHAALCARELVITSAVGSVSGSIGPRDPNFVELIAQVSLSLFPPDDPIRRGGRNFRIGSP